METVEIKTKRNYASAVEPVDDAGLITIETKGYAVIRSFLSQEEMSIILKDYHAAQSRNKKANFQINNACSPTFDLLKWKMAEIAKSVGKFTSTKVDAEQGGEYFSIESGVQFPWRQNHKSFYRNQNHTDYLNFYMIITKERKDKANVGVIPFDKLCAVSPECYKKVLGGGATRFVVRDGETHIYADEINKKIGTLSYDIGTLSESPHLNAGDLLLMRGDLIHCTPESHFCHVALAIRMVNSDNRINLTKMVRGSKAKILMMIEHRRTFSRIFNAFQKLKTTEATYSELISKFSLDKSPAPSKLKFVLRIFRLRLQFIFR